MNRNDGKPPLYFCVASHIFVGFFNLFYFLINNKQDHEISYRERDVTVLKKVANKVKSIKILNISFFFFLTAMDVRITKYSLN